jgi:hypothetical protein
LQVCLQLLASVAGHIDAEHVTVEPDGGIVNGGLHVHLLPLLDRRKYIRALVPRLPMRSVLRAAALKLWDTQAAHDLILECVTQPCGCFAYVSWLSLDVVAGASFAREQNSEGS